MRLFERRRSRFVLRAILALAASVAVAGCETSSGPGVEQSGTSPDAFRGLDESERSVGSPKSDFSGSGPAALVDDLVVERDVAWTHLAEAGGGQVLEDLVLDALLERELDARGLTISPEDVQDERALLIESIAETDTGSADDAERLLASLRVTRGLGPIRFESLLRRNAMLRAIVSRDVVITPASVERLYRVRYGPRYRARLFLAPTERAAARVLNALSGVTGAELEVRFADAAMRESIDQSAFAGGLLEPISPEDPAYPTAVREVLPQLQPGELSPIIALDTGYAVVYLVERVPASGVPFESVRGELERALRSRTERIRMSAFAQRLLDQATVSPLDPALARAWRQRRELE